MLNETGSKSDQEKEISMIVSSVRDEDELYEKTGIDLVQFNNSVIKSKLNQDPDFIKIV